MIKAFRDTWELGIHSYLTYLRDRLLLAQRTAWPRLAVCSSRSRTRISITFARSWTRCSGLTISVGMIALQDRRLVSGSASRNVATTSYGTRRIVQNVKYRRSVSSTKSLARRTAEDVSVRPT